MISIELNSTTRVTLKQCSVPNDLHELLIERDIGRSDKARAKTQIFLNSEELNAFYKNMTNYMAECSKSRK